MSVADLARAEGWRERSSRVGETRKARRSHRCRESSHQGGPNNSYGASRLCSGRQLDCRAGELHGQH
jgi:hypothetical protein